MEAEAEHLIPQAIPPTSQPAPLAKTAKVPWIPLAAASGACAAFNGVFAKLCVERFLREVLRNRQADNYQHDDRADVLLGFNNLHLLESLLHQQIH